MESFPWPADQLEATTRQPESSGQDRKRRLQVEGALCSRTQAREDAVALRDPAPLTPELVEPVNLAVTILGGPTGVGGLVWSIWRMQADMRDLRADFREFRDENTRQHEYLTQRIDRLLDSRID